MKSLGYRQVGKYFPVFLHPESGEEYALARIERKVGSGYSGFEFNTSKEVTLEQDLLRRDLTINAIAKGKGSDLIDPCGGVKDIERKTLRHISDAFTEDPVRLLRVARFAQRFNSLGFKIASETRLLMRQMVISGEVDSLVPERVFRELSLALSAEKVSIFFNVLSECGAYQRIFPMLEIENSVIDKLDTVEDIKPEIQFAIWLQQQKIEIIDALCGHLKCPKEYQKLAELSSKWGPFMKDFMKHSAKEILDFYLQTDAIRRGDRFAKLLTVFRVLGFDVQIAPQLADGLRGIDVSELNKAQIVDELYKKRLSLIRQFLDTT
jgi:tRNA nucleotidyltransferase (CCA-adding enzyme)